MNDLYRVLNVLKQSRGDEKNKHKRACLSSFRVPIFLEPDFIMKKNWKKPSLALISLCLAFKAKQGINDYINDKTVKVKY